MKKTGSSVNPSFSPFVHLGWKTSLPKNTGCLLLEGRPFCRKYLTESVILQADYLQKVVLNMVGAELLLNFILLCIQISSF